MFDERKFIQQVEAADPAEFAALLMRPTPEQERALRSYLGDARYERMRELAVRRPSRGVAARKGNVVVLHGIMGGELTAYDPKGDGDLVWVNILRIVGGSFARLRLDAAGTGETDAGTPQVAASGILKRTYGEQLLALAQDWNVRAFWYDWRRDLREAADELAVKLHEWFPGQPAHLVAHSMGGLVARAFIAAHPDQWKAMWDGDGDGRAGGRLVMLGTPNYGSFAVPQIVTGLEGMVRKLAAADLRHGLQDVLGIVASFPGIYQMMPSLYKLPEATRLYSAATYPAAPGVPQQHLSTAQVFHRLLEPVVDPARMLYVAGYDQATLAGVDGPVDQPSSYVTTLEGDGRVPHVLGLLPGVTAYYVDEAHGDLPGNAAVLAATRDLLATGDTDHLPRAMPKTRGAKASAERKEAERRSQDALDEAALRAYAEQTRVRGAVPGAERVVTDDERRAAVALTRGWLSGDEAPPATLVPPTPPADTGAAAPAGRPAAGGAPATDAGGAAAPPAPARRRRGGRRGRGEAHGPRRARIEVALRLGSIAEVDGEISPVDAVAVGHYVGVAPQNAELALDVALTRAILGRSAGAAVGPTELVLTQLAERGTLRGELGQPFILPDPRPAEDGAPPRLVVIAGMGVVGRFGAPELTVLARELCWTLGRIGRHHLATVVIGSGVGNLSLDDAVAAWMRGVHAALAGTDGEEGQLQRITFVEASASRIEPIQDAIEAAQRALAASGDMELDYEAWPQERLAALEPQVRAEAERERRRRRDDVAAENRAPTRITLGLDRRGERTVFRFGAITEDAALPEREIPLDASLVDEANDTLPGLSDPARQLARGQYLGELLVPDDLRESLSSDAPLVMLLDAATARVHWEMVAQPGLLDPGETGAAAAHFESCFLGTSRGLTRQLRTTFAPPPEAPPPPTQPLRVLVVADPDQDAPLPGAQREAYDVADLFARADGMAGRTVEVLKLIGPAEATRTNVLEAIMLQHFDVLHYAGHCAYDEKDPPASGWIFTGGKRLSANELRRIDHIPKFVFSNACESGITPDRSRLRSAGLAPSFAEAFFDRGVANFVCTAWPVDDEAARLFALHVYAALLGLGTPQDPTATRGPRREPTCMHVGMRTARLAISRTPGGIGCWGAYQHYGNPNFRLFDPRTRDAADARREAEMAAAGNG